MLVLSKYSVVKSVNDADLVFQLANKLNSNKKSTPRKGTNVLLVEIKILLCLGNSFVLKFEQSILNSS